MTSGVAPELTKKLYEAATAGKVEEARRLQYLVRQIFDKLLFGADFPEACRVAIELRGLKMGPTRQPLSEEHKKTLAAIFQPSSSSPSRSRS